MTARGSETPESASRRRRQWASRRRWCRIERTSVVETALIEIARWFCRQDRNVGDRQDVLGLTLRRRPRDDDTGSGAPTVAAPHRTHRRGHREPPSATRCDALECGVDTVLHQIEDVETSYEHELVTIRDDLQSTLRSLLEARRGSATRVARLEARTRDAAVAETAKRLARMERFLTAASDVTFHSLDRNVGAAAAAHAKARLATRATRWRLAFLFLFAVGAHLVAKLRAWHTRVTRTHML